MATFFFNGYLSNPVIERVEKKLALWKSNCLSLGGGIMPVIIIIIILDGCEGRRAKNTNA